MINLGGIGARASYFTVDDRKSVAVLSAQLGKYQTQLADWVNCPSCKTPEGKAKISAITDKIAEIKQQMKASAPAQAEQRDNGINTSQIPSRTQRISAMNDQIPKQTNASSSSSLIGGLLSVYA